MTGGSLLPARSPIEIRSTMFRLAVQGLDVFERPCSKRSVMVVVRSECGHSLWRNNPETRLDGLWKLR
ncbi:MAG: hypothetical protein LAQ69_38135 [Acidobacteriia bacterium]|nr:hypothetical protein [Terriglobia bacterium]